MTKDTVLLIGIDLGSEKDYQCATLDLYYNETDHIIYQTFDKEQVAVLKEIMEEVAKEKAAVQRLEAIDNANPSEALECLESMSNEKALFRSILSRSTVYMGGEQIDDFSDKSTIGNKFKGAIPIIKQALIKAQEQEKVLEIIKKKDVDLRDLKAYFKVERGLQEYNKHQYKENELTQEEFDLLKRHVES